MTDIQLENRILGARPLSREYSSETQHIMSNIKRQSQLKRALEKKVALRQKGIRSRLLNLHGVGFAAAVITTLLIAGSVAYATATRFVPDLLKLLDKQTTSTGQVEYTVPGFADCYNPARVKPGVFKFDVTPTAHMSNKDALRTLQAKCELAGMDTIANGTWPTYGDHKVWKPGDNIYYAQPDLMGTVVNVDNSGVVLQYSGGAQPTKIYRVVTGRALQVFNRGRRVANSTLKPGDYVFTIVQTRDVYQSITTMIDGIEYDTPNQGPSQTGLLGVIELSLPKQYYTSFQGYVHEVKPCIGNTDERCADGPTGSMLDVFPLASDESLPATSSNMHTKGAVGREISGIVTSIQTHNFTLKASSGKIYTIGLEQSVLQTYNTTSAMSYMGSSRVNIDQVQVRQGSWMDVLYTQSPREDRLHAAQADITRIMLFTDVRI